MAQKSNLELAKERIVQQYGTDNCNILVKMPLSEKTFSVLKKRIEKKFSMYKDVLPEEQYHEFLLQRSRKNMEFEVKPVELLLSHIYVLQMKCNANVEDIERI